MNEPWKEPPFDIRISEYVSSKWLKLCENMYGAAATIVFSERATYEMSKFIIDYKACLDS